MKKIKLLIFSCIFFLSLISISSALIYTSPAQINLNEGTTSLLITFLDLPSGNTTISLSSNLQSYLHLQWNYINPSEDTSHIYLDNLPSVNVSGFLFYGGQDTPVNIIVAEEEQVYEGDISFPSAKTFNVQQNQIYNKEIKLILPFNYPNSILIQTIEFSEETQILRWGDKEEGISVNPGDVFSIPLIIDTTDAQSGDYPPIDVIVRYDDNGINQLKSTVNIHVYESINPAGSDTFSTPPTCSLSATTFNLNNTYSFVCSGVVSNLQVEPQYSEYFEGKTVKVSSGLYKYEFIPLKYGETDFVAIFKYLDSPIFQPYKQTVRITSAGSLVPGTSLKFIFTPKLDEATGDEEAFLIQLGDNKTGSLVQGPRMWVNAIELNSSTGTFEYSFTPNTDYEVRGKAEGYEDIVQTINIKPQKIEIRITPGTGDTLTTFSINTSVENATIIIGEVDYFGSYLGLLPGGVNEIKAVKEGYKTEIINFTVEDRIRVVSFGGEFKKGVDQNFTLNKNASWIVYHKKSMDDVERTEIAKGTGDLIFFLPEKKGVYVIEAEGTHIGTYEIPGFSFKNKWWIFPAWVWFLIFVPIVIIIIILGIRKKMRSSYNQESQDGAGLSFNVGDE